MSGPEIGKMGGPFSRFTMTTLGQNDLDNSRRAFSYEIVTSDPKPKKSKAPLALGVTAIALATVFLPKIGKKLKITSDIRFYGEAESLKQKSKYIFVKVANKIEGYEKTLLAKLTKAKSGFGNIFDTVFSSHNHKRKTKPSV